MKLRERIKKITDWFWKQPLNRRFFISYTLIFILLAFFVFIEYIINGRTFVWYKDGYNQHIKSALYNAQWLKGFMRDLIKYHKISLDTYSFGLGYGGDIVTTLNYYTFGDIIYLPTVYLSRRAVVAYFDFVVVLRFYLAGLSFFGLFNYIEKRDGRSYRLYQALSGALIYTFSAFSLVAGLRHPQFMTPVVMFPCMIWGLEKLLEEKKIYLFVISIYVMAMANFVFFYMTAVLTVAYFIWRELEIKGRKNLKAIFKDLMITAGSALLGIMLAGAIVFPIISAYMGDPRIGKGIHNPFFYSFFFIKYFAESFMSVDMGVDYTSMGYGALGALVILCLFVNRKDNKRLLRGFLIMTVMVFMPLFGYIMYGTSYAGNRWIWGYSLLVCYIVSRTLPEIFKLSFKKLISLYSFAVIYLLICLALDYSLSENSSLQMIILFAILFVSTAYSLAKDSNEEEKAILSKMKKRVGYVAVLAASVGLLANIYYRFSYRKVDKASEGVEWEVFNEVPEPSEFMDWEEIDPKIGSYWNTPTYATVQTSGFTKFYRMSGNDPDVNNGLLYGVSTTDYFWSTSNPNMSEFRKRLAIGDVSNRIFSYNALDDRIALMSLTGVGVYYKKGKYLPYGFYEMDETRVEKAYPYELYDSYYNLPLAFGYTSVMSESDSESLNPVQLEKAFLKTAVIGDDDLSEQNSRRGTVSVVKNVDSLDLTEYDEIEYEYGSLADSIGMDGNRIVTTDEEQKLNLKPLNSESDESEDKEEETDEEEGVASENESVDSGENDTIDEATVTDANESNDSEEASMADQTSSDADKDSEYENPGLYRDYSYYLYITGLTFESTPRYKVYKGSNEKYDLNDNFSEDDWKELPLKTRRNMIRDFVLYRPADYSTLKFVFRFKDGSTVVRTLEVNSKTFQWGTDNTDFIINAGDNRADDLDYVQIVFPTVGCYTIDDIRIIRQPLSDIGDCVEDLELRELFNVDMHKNSISYATQRVTGDYTAFEDTFLYFNIPYDKGWSVYVDGNERELVRANIGFMGTFVEAGEHSIELRYETPGLKLGIVLAIIGIFIFAGFLVNDYLRLANEEEAGKSKSKGNSKKTNKEVKTSSVKKKSSKKGSSKKKANLK